MTLKESAVVVPERDNPESSQPAQTSLRTVTNLRFQPEPFVNVPPNAGVNIGNNAAKPAVCMPIHDENLEKRYRELVNANAQLSKEVDNFRIMTIKLKEENDRLKYEIDRIRNTRGTHLKMGILLI
ncbi:unnamed protein product [Thelazia callipaeda]|uniref:PRKG1_interact domain-containing protein n=1 Tax=Thelazia callipaeda TaxID=103827 RepID=A0A0N5CUZ9_THECL|nr:unnamed protein product [Thelazia callipaeda]